MSEVTVPDSFVRDYVRAATDALCVRVITDVLEELEGAADKFPTWPTDPLHAVGVVNKEVGELAKAVLQRVYEPEKNPPGAVRDEAIQAAAMLIRFMIRMGTYAWEPGKRL